MSFSFFCNGAYCELGLLALVICCIVISLLQVLLVLSLMVNLPELVLREHMMMFLLTLPPVLQIMRLQSLSPQNLVKPLNVDHVIIQLIGCLVLTGIREYIAEGWRIQPAQKDCQYHLSVKVKLFVKTVTFSFHLSAHTVATVSFIVNSGNERKVKTA